MSEDDPDPPNRNDLADQVLRLAVALYWQMLTVNAEALGVDYCRKLIDTVNECEADMLHELHRRGEGYGSNSAG